MQASAVEFLAARNAPFRPASRQCRRLQNLRVVAACNGDTHGTGANGTQRRQLLQGLAAGAALCLLPAVGARAASDFVQSPSGLLIQDIT